MKDQLPKPPQHMLYPEIRDAWGVLMMPPACKPSCLKCAEDRKRNEAQKRRQECHVPDPHYGDWINGSG